jgi:hypothetical protein
LNNPDQAISTVTNYNAAWAGLFVIMAKNTINITTLTEPVYLRLLLGDAGREYSVNPNSIIIVG